MADVPGAWRPPSLLPLAESLCGAERGDPRTEVAGEKSGSGHGAPVLSCSGRVGEEFGGPGGSQGLGDDDGGWEEGVSSHVKKEGGRGGGVGGALTVRSEYAEESPRTLKLRIIREQLLNVEKERELAEMRLSPGVCGWVRRMRRGREREGGGQRDFASLCTTISVSIMDNYLCIHKHAPCVCVCVCVCVCARARMCLRVCANTDTGEKRGWETHGGKGVRRHPHSQPRIRPVVFRNVCTPAYMQGSKQANKRATEGGSKGPLTFVVLSHLFLFA